MQRFLRHSLSLSSLPGYCASRAEAPPGRQAARVTHACGPRRAMHSPCPQGGGEGDHCFLAAAAPSADGHNQELETPYLSLFYQVDTVRRGLGSELPSQKKGWSLAVLDCRQGHQATRRGMTLPTDPQDSAETGQTPTQAPPSLKRPPIGRE